MGELDAAKYFATYEDVVDLGRYPIQDLEAAAGAALVADCRRQLASTGAACLPGFLLPTAVDAMVAVAQSLRPRAWPSDQAHTVTFEPLDPTVDAEHTRGRQVRSAKKGIAYDLLPADAATRRLYESEHLTAFVAAALGAGVLYRSADPLDARKGRGRRAAPPAVGEHRVVLRSHLSRAELSGPDQRKPPCRSPRRVATPTSPPGSTTLGATTWPLPGAKRPEYARGGATNQRLPLRRRAGRARRQSIR